MLRKVCFIILLLLGVLRAQADCTSGTIDPPVIDSISVLPNGDLVISWLDVFDSDLSLYNIWTIDDTGANVQLNVAAIPVGTTSFTLLASDPNNVAADGCMQIMVQAVMNCPPPLGQVPNPVLSSGVGFVCTPFIEGIFVPCTGSVDLTWNANEFFNNPRYQVYVSIDGALAVPAGPPILGTSSSYPGIVFGKTYDFYLVSTNNGGLGTTTATSNISTPSIDGFLFMPTFNYLNYATVVDSQQIDLRFTIDTFAAVTSYKIQRATSDLGPFTTIASVSKFDGMDTIVNYSDIGLNTDSTSYAYQIEIVNDNCGFDSNYSNIATTVLIGVSSNPLEAYNTITITEYKDWDLGVLRYDIYRALGGVWELTPVRSFPAFSDTMTYVDDVSEVVEGNGEFCYKVIAIGKGLSPVAESSSNESCALHEPLIYMPSAFAPSGLYNTEFKPVLTFANPTSYLFRVFNRWGVVVFQTKNVWKAWNGRFKNSGDLSPIGVYFYVVEFDSAIGTSFTKRGTVTIVN